MLIASRDVLNFGTTYLEDWWRKSVDSLFSSGTRWSFEEQVHTFVTVSKQMLGSKYWITDPPLTYRMTLTEALC